MLSECRMTQILSSAYADAWQFSWWIFKIYESRHDKTLYEGPKIISSAPADFVFISSKKKNSLFDLKSYGPVNKIKFMSVNLSPK